MHLLIVKLLHGPTAERDMWQGRVEGIAIDDADFIRRTTAPDGSRLEGYALWRGYANVGDLIHRVGKAP